MTVLRSQALRFILIGATSTLLYFGLLIGLRPLVTSVLLLTAFCYGLSMGFNFLAQGMFTFQLQRLAPRQMRRYLVMHGSAMATNSAAMALLVNGFGLYFVASQIVVTGAITVATFLLSKSWVYT